MSNLYLGVDPGKHGGVAILWEQGRVALLTPIPESLGDLHSLLTLDDLLIDDPCTVHAVLEKVGGYTGQGQPGSAMFNFGKGVGQLEALLYANGISYEEVPPQRWQKAMGITPKKKTETKTQWKNRLRGMAQKLFPREKITLATADALLMAEYLRRKHEGVK